MIDRIIDWVNKNKSLIHSTYHDLHQNPEISWEELRTTEYLCKQLKSLDIPFQTFMEHTGVIGYWGTKNDGPVIGLRADMDALWQLVDGKWRANHSCGHDAHMTMVLHTITCLKRIGYKPPGLIKIIFQPAEESGKGAKALIERGVIDDIDYLLGVHLRPIQEMRFGQASPAIYHGATTLLKGKIRGVSAHGARPNLGINVIDSLSAIIHAVNSIKMDPTQSASVKVTMARAGGDNINIIPDYAEFGIDVRGQQNDVMQELLKQVNHAVLTAGSANHAVVEIEPLASMAAAQSSKVMESVVNSAIVEVLGKDGVVLPPVTPGGEDFHFYQYSYPHIHSTMVGLGTDLLPGLHHPNMEFNLDSLQNGVKILSAATIKLFSLKKNNHNNEITLHDSTI